MINAEQTKAFFKGMKEFRSDITTHYGVDLIEYYDSGRDLSHKLTFRIFEKEY
jgi:hypothetical protein